MFNVVVCLSLEISAIYCVIKLVEYLEAILLVVAQPMWLT